MQIRDLVTLDQHVEERSVVQIEFFTDKERNLSLVKSFIFTRRAPEGKSSTIDILRRLYESACTEVLENVFCVIANYGYGKSHFGLILANYFGKPVGSHEFNTIVDKLEHSGEDPALVHNLREFRKGRKPYLVIRLRGDEPYPLDQQFLQATKRALKEHGITGNMHLWYDSAAEWLQSRQNDPVFTEQANRFLERYETDVAQLLDRLRNYDHEAVRLFNEMSSHLFGAPLNLEGNHSADELLKDVHRRYCKEQNRFGGVLVLFDEFGLFLRNYLRSQSYLGSLQRLLEAIDALRPHVLFVGFAQEDPVNVMALVGDNALRDNVQRELQRLPLNNKLLLHSRMEQVIDSYLKQDDTRWEQLRRNQSNFDDLLWDAASLTMDCFRNVYSSQMEWLEEQFDEAVTKGCYPLHPLTTAIVCNCSLGSSVQSDTPRTVLGFVIQSVRQKLSEPVFQDGRLNLVHPIQLVDYFEPLLPAPLYQSYRRALQSVEHTNSALQKAVLKALLLIEVAGLPVDRDRFFSLVEHLSGHPSEEVKSALERMHSERVIDCDRGVYRLWSAGVDLARLQSLRERVQSGLDSQAIRDTVEKIQRELLPDQVQVSVGWGGVQDWSASCDVLTRDRFSSRELQRLATAVEWNGKDWQVCRGRIVYLLALNVEDVAWFRQHAQHVMDEAFPDPENAPAMLLVLPKEDAFEFIALYRWERYLLRKITEEEVQAIGEEMRSKELRRTREQREGFFEALFPVETAISWDHLVVPSALRMVVRHTGEDEIQVSSALRRLYERVYRFAPTFFAQYSHSTTRLRSDTRQICIALAKNDLANAQDLLEPNGIGRDCISRYLQAEWRILDGKHKVCAPPSSSKVRKAWEFLESNLPEPGKSVPLRELIRPLLNAPYGYHFHQLALLISAWYGYHRHELQLSLRDQSSTRPVPLEAVWELRDVDRSERFLARLLSDAHLTRLDIDRQQQEDIALARRVNNAQRQFSQDEAEQMIVCLGEAVGREYADSIKAEIQQALETLQKDLDSAREYEKQVKRVLGTRVRTIRDLVDDCRNLATNPPHLGRVLPNEPPLPEVKQRLLQDVEAVVKRWCQEAEEFSSLEDAGKHLSRLKQLRSEVDRLGEQELMERVAKAIDEVERRRKQMKEELADAPVIAKLEAFYISSQTPLKQLRQIADNIKQLEPRTVKAQNLRRDRLDEVQKAIMRLQEGLQDWQKRLSAFQIDGNLADLRELERELLQERLLYEGASEETAFNNLLQSCQEAVRRAEEVDAVSSILTSLQRINSEEELRRIRDAVERRLQELA